MVLLTDIVSFFPTEGHSVVNLQFVMNRVEMMSRYNNDGHLT